MATHAVRATMFCLIATMGFAQWSPDPAENLAIAVAAGPLPAPFPECGADPAGDELGPCASERCP